MGVDKLTKLILLEWKKLNQQQVMIELIIYWLILFFFPTFFIKVAMPVFGESYDMAIELNWFIQKGMILFGASLISQVFIQEYKSKTISLSFGYPISRKKLFTAKVLFISLFIFLSTVISYLFSGMITYMLDQVFPIINGQPSSSDMAKFFGSMMIRLVDYYNDELRSTLYLWNVEKSHNTNRNLRDHDHEFTQLFIIHSS